MDITRLCELHPFYSKAQGPEDNARILALFARSPMHVGGLSLLYDRSPDFSNLLHCRSDKTVTLQAVKDGRLLFVFTVSVALGWVDGQLLPYAYIGDFRADGSREAARAWRKSYKDVIATIQNDQSWECPPLLLTAILGENQAALHNLASAKSRYGFSYRSLASLEMVNVFARKPWARWTQKTNDFTVRLATAADESALRQFLQREESKRSFGSELGLSREGEQEWNFRTKSWPDFKVQNFYLALSGANEIVGCTLPWNPDFAKRMRVVAAPRSMRLSLRVLKGLGLAVPLVGESLSVVYLTHLNIAEHAKSEDIISSFLKTTFQSQKGISFISFAKPAQRKLPLKSYFSQRVPVELFNVEIDTSIPPTGDFSSVAFEMGLV